jgi:hypothetical protein
MAVLRSGCPGIVWTRLFSFSAWLHSGIVIGENDGGVQGIGHAMRNYWHEQISAGRQIQGPQSQSSNRVLNDPGDILIGMASFEYVSHVFTAGA